MSPSSRRAWVEIAISLTFSLSSSVALLAEGVGRNSINDVLAAAGRASPSSRRAWVEITTKNHRGQRAGSRPPRGGRG